MVLTRAHVMRRKNPLHSHYYLLGRRIHYLRKKRGLTQKRFSEKLEITPSHLASVEAGLKKPSVDLLFSIAKALDVKDLDLFKYE